MRTPPEGEEEYQPNEGEGRGKEGHPYHINPLKVKKDINLKSSTSGGTIVLIFFTNAEKPKK